MKKKIIVTLFIVILIMQGIAPIKINAADKNPIFNSDITFSWEFIENDDIMDYGLCTPSNADDYKEIPLIVWLHGLEQQGGDGNEISTAYDGFPKAILSGNTLEGFCAYVVCPHIPVYNSTRNNMDRNSDRSVT